MNVIQEVREVFSALATNQADLTAFLADRELFLDQFVLSNGQKLSPQAKNRVSFDINRINWQFYIEPGGTISANKVAETVDVSVPLQQVVAKHSNGSPFINAVTTSAAINATDKQGAFTINLDTSTSAQVLTTVVFAITLRPGKTTSALVTAVSDQTILLGPDLPVRATYNGSTEVDDPPVDRDVYLSGFVNAENQSMLLAFRDFPEPPTY